MLLGTCCQDCASPWSPLPCPCCHDPDSRLPLLCHCCHDDDDGSPPDSQLPRCLDDDDGSPPNSQMPRCHRESRLQSWETAAAAVTRGPCEDEEASSPTAAVGWPGFGGGGCKACATCCVATTAAAGGLGFGGGGCGAGATDGLSGSEVRNCPGVSSALANGGKSSSTSGGRAGGTCGGTVAGL